MTPRVSIGMPVRNGEPYLSAAIESVLAQTYPDFELVISDNASDDDTERICRCYADRESRIRYYRNVDNIGAARNFNRVFELSRGEYFKWFAHDDLLAPTYLQRCVETLDKAPKSVVLCFPRRRIMAPDGRPLDCDPFLLSQRDAREDFHNASFARLVRISASCFPIFAFGLMRREAAKKTRLIGGYVAADLVFVAEMRLAGELWEVPEELYFQRLHAATPDVLARTTRSGEAAWFDPENAERWLRPEGELLFQYIGAIHRSDVSALQKAKCYLSLGGHVASRIERSLRRMPKRARLAAWRHWSAVSRLFIRTTPLTALPLRAWVLSAAVRRRQRDKFSLAFAAPGKETKARLVSFAAERLATRTDVASHRLLAQMVLSGDERQCVAAARALGPHPQRYSRALACVLESASADNRERALRMLCEQGGADSADAWRSVFAKAPLSEPAALPDQHEPRTAALR